MNFKIQINHAHEWGIHIKTKTKHSTHLLNCRYFILFTFQLPQHHPVLLFLQV